MRRLFFNAVLPQAIQKGDWYDSTAISAVRRRRTRERNLAPGSFPTRVPSYKTQRPIMLSIPHTKARWQGHRALYSNFKLP